MSARFPRYASFAAIGGGGLLVGLLLANDPLLTWQRVAGAGWAIVLVSLYRFLPLAFDTAGWTLLFERGGRPPPGRAFVARWIGESVNALLPMAQVGGDVVRAGLAARGIPGGVAASGAATMADFTLGLVAQVLFTIAGVALLIAAVAPGRLPVPAAALAAAVLTFAVLIAGFFVWQHRGGPARLAAVLAGAIRRLGPGLARFAVAGFGDGFERRLRDVYGRRGAVAGCLAWRLAGWLVRTGETAIVLWLLAQPVTFTNLVVLESLSYAVRSAAFFVPGALGVQEAGLLGLGLALGLAPDVALALAVIKRAREVLVGLPALAVWALPSAYLPAATKLSSQLKDHVTEPR